MESFSVEVLNRLRTAKIAAGFSVEEPRHAVSLVHALLAGGITAIELTLRTPAAIEALQAVCELKTEMLIGAGTILSTDMVQQVKNAGVDFGVSPGTNPNVVNAARAVGLPFAPGVCTPSDIEAAVELGCRVLKFFPAEPSGGVKFLRSMSAPYKHLGIEYFPLGGVNSQNMLDYLNEPNIVAVGGTWIVRPELVQQEAWSEITHRAKEVVEMIKGAETVG